MSYARFGEDSHVYVFATIEGACPCGPECSIYGTTKTRLVECCGCTLIPRDSEGRFAAPSSVQFRTSETLLAHLREHEAAGHKVPECAFRRITEDGWLLEDAEAAFPCREHLTVCAELLREAGSRD